MAAARFSSTPELSGSTALAVNMNETQLAGVALAAIVLLASIIVASRAARTLSLRNRKLAERELEVQKIFDHLHEGIVILDPKRNLVQINKSARRILGLSSNFVSQDSLANSFEVFLADGTFLPKRNGPARSRFAESIWRTVSSSFAGGTPATR